MSKFMNIIVMAMFFSVVPIFAEYTYLNLTDFDDFVEIHTLHIEKVENDTVYYYLNRTSEGQYSSDFYRGFYAFDENGDAYIKSNIALPSIVIPEGYDEFIATYKVEDLEPGQYFMEVEYTLNLKYGLRKTISLRSEIYDYEH